MSDNGKKLWYNTRRTVFLQEDVRLPLSRQPAWNVAGALIFSNQSRRASASMAGKAMKMIEQLVNVERMEHTLALFGSFDTNVKMIEEA